MLKAKILREADQPQQAATAAPAAPAPAAPAKAEPANQAPKQLTAVEIQNAIVNSINGYFQKTFPGVLKQSLEALLPKEEPVPAPAPEAPAPAAPAAPAKEQPVPGK